MGSGRDEDLEGVPREEGGFYVVVVGCTRKGDLYESKREGNSAPSPIMVYHIDAIISHCSTFR